MAADHKGENRIT